jgi:hypothetical protein
MCWATQMLGTLAQVANAMLSSKPGSIILAHMRRPKRGTAEGIEAALPKLRRRGFRFVLYRNICAESIPPPTAPRNGQRVPIQSPGTQASSEKGKIHDDCHHLRVWQHGHCHR